MLNRDIRQLDEETLERVLGGRQVHLVVGGPPCQSYSTVGRRQMDGPGAAVSGVPAGWWTFSAPVFLSLRM